MKLTPDNIEKLKKRFDLNIPKSELVEVPIKKFVNSDASAIDKNLIRDESIDIVFRTLFNDKLGFLNKE